MRKEADPWEAWERISLKDASTLRSEEQLLHTLGWLRTEVNNGGFDQYFFNSAGDDALLAQQAALESGVKSLEDLIGRACGLLGHPYPTSRDERHRALDAGGAELETALERLDSEYLALEVAEDLDEAMRTFV